MEKSNKKKDQHAKAKKIAAGEEKKKKNAGQKKDVSKDLQLKLKTALDPQEAKFLAEGTGSEGISAVRYFAIKYNDVPSTVTFSQQEIEAIALLKKLKNDMGAKLIHAYFMNGLTPGDRKLIRYTLSFPGYSYLLQATQITSRDAAQYDTPDFLDDFENEYNGFVYTSPVTLYQPSDASLGRDEDFEDEVMECINYCTLQKIPDRPHISMVELKADGNFMLQSYPVQDNFIIRNLDMHYGYGFEKFHNDLMLRFQKETRGLVLFHGEPGTGKTYYIRHLLRKMKSYDKVVIYMPPNIVEHLVDPGFISFLSKEIAAYSAQGNFCVLLIEDAEPLLASRHTDIRVQGISNLLNLTDGLLNDMLKLQIICTFNVKVKELDEALLRPGRLIARKEFKEMTVLDANRLGQQLGIKYHFTKPATLAEVYSMVQNKNTLVHTAGDTEMEE